MHVNNATSVGPIDPFLRGAAAKVAPAKQADTCGSTILHPRPGPPAPVLRELPIGDGTGAVDPPVDPPSSGPLTIEGLQEAWGTKDPNYDLNGNGTVDFADLLQLLARLAETPEAPPQRLDAPPLGGAETPPAPDVTAGAQSAAPDPAPGQDLAAAAPATGTDGPADGDSDGALTVAGLLAAWGQDGGVYDTNADGTVNFADLLKLLGKLGTRAPEVPEAARGPAEFAARPGKAIDPGPPAPAEDPNDGRLTIEGLLAAWGESGGVYDTNADGTVNFADVLKLLGKLGHGGPGSGGPGSNGPSGLAGPDGAGATRADRVRNAADGLIARLEARGFDDHPPVNIHQVVARLDLPEDDRRDVLREIGARYPQGLGLNVLG